jgi:arylsulfatase A-like enzyme
MNVLLITLDQFRGDALSVAGHPVARTPHLDRLAREGVRFARHYAQAAPCGPGRASLYTGLYAMTHRVVANGTPLDVRFDNLAWAAARAGLEPTLFGYTDQALDPRLATGPEDPRLATYEAILPGFATGLHLPMGDLSPWLAWLGARGHVVGTGGAEASLAALKGEPARPAEHSLAAHLTEVFLAWLETRQGPWFAHLSHLRPHPPYSAAGAYAELFDPADMPDPVPAPADPHALHARLMTSGPMAAPAERTEMARIQAQYFGMISEVDAQLGRVWAALEQRGTWDDTLIVVTADHGEQLGDQGLIGKGGFYEASYHIPCLIRDPRPVAVRGAVVEAFTEAVDIFPTLCEALGVAIPAQCDGRPLTPFLHGATPPVWRAAAHWEWDWRSSLTRRGEGWGPWDRRIETRNLCVSRGAEAAFVHFGSGESLAFDLLADPDWGKPLADPARALDQARELLTWRATHADRTWTGLLMEDGGLGRWPDFLPAPLHAG